MRLFDSRATKIARILAYLQEHPGLNYALDICKGTGYSPGSIYYILAWLENEGLVDHQWVDQPDGKPRRMGYRYVEGGGGGYKVRQPRENRRRRYGLAWGAV